MSDESLPPGIGAVSQEDAAEAYSGPAFTSNHFIVQGYGGSLRIAFLEKYDLQKPSRYRTAVSVQITDLPILINLLSRHVKGTENV